MKIDKIDDFQPGITRIKYGGAYTSDDDFAAIQSVLDRNWWTIDEHNTKLEEEIARKTKMKFATVTNSGSSALLVGYNALTYPHTSEIITGAVHFPTSISSLYFNRLKPVYIDNEEQTLGLNPDLIERAVTERTRAILVVAIAGSIPNLPRIAKIAEKYGLDIILDNCDGFGGTINGEYIETFAKISCTSFHAAHIVAMGEGGAIITNDPVVDAKARSVKEWGRVGDTDVSSFKDMVPDDYPGRYIFQHMGFNLKPLELQCAMGRTQLQKLEKIKLLRARNYDMLYEGLKNIPQLQLLKQIDGAEPSWFGFPMFAKDRPGLRKFLESRQIETRTIFGGNITKQPAFRNFGHIVTALHVADRVMTEGMFVSVHPANTPAMNEYIINTIVEYYG